MSDLTFARCPRISLRRLPRGGALAEEPRATPATLLSNADELMILIHGYSNDEDVAFAAYERFMKNVGAEWSQMAVCVYWPGDSLSDNPGARVGFLYPVSRFTTYSWQPPRASEAGEKLATAVIRAIDPRKAVALRSGRIPEPQNLNIVAHSMGCRFALEFISHLSSRLELEASRGQAPVNVRLVVLMAPAVPLYLVDARKPLGRALGKGECTLVYWSAFDSALGLIFRFGQGWKSDRPSWPFAKRRSSLGKVGAPDRQRVMFRQTELEHSEYWASGRIASEVGREFEKLYGTGPQARKVADRVVGFRLMEQVSPGSVERPLPAGRAPFH